MDLQGNGTGQFIIDGGTTTMAQSSTYTEKLGVPFLINSGAIVSYKSCNSLQLTTDINAIIHIKGEMDFYWGQTGNGITLISGGASNPDDNIWVDGGNLVYYGR